MYPIIIGDFQGKQEEMSEGCANVVSPEGKPGASSGTQSRNRIEEREIPVADTEELCQRREKGEGI